jgi:hypothetical protein
MESDIQQKLNEGMNSLTISSKEMYHIVLLKDNYELSLDLVLNDEELLGIWTACYLNIPSNDKYLLDIIKITQKIISRCNGKFISEIRRVLPENREKGVSDIGHIVARYSLEENYNKDKIWMSHVVMITSCNNIKWIVQYDNDDFINAYRMACGWFSIKNEIVLIALIH